MRALALLVAAATAFAGEARLVDGPFRAEGEIVAPGAPGPLCVFGKDAFVVAVGGAGGRLQAPVAAGTTLGKGRVVAFGHTGYLDGGVMRNPDTRRMMMDALDWVSPRRRRDGDRVFHYKRPALGLALGAIGEWDGTTVPKMCDVLVADAGAFDDAERRAAVAKFLESGGGLLTASLGWGWKQLRPGKDLRTEHGGNLLLARAGIVWADGTLRKTGANGFVQPESFSAHLHARAALDDGASSPQAGWTLSLATRAVPDEADGFPRRLRGAVRGVSFEAARSIGPEDGLARLAMTLWIEDAKRAAPGKVRDHPWARRFPGAVPHGAERVDRAVSVDTGVPRWHSTGLYAPAGEVITVRGGKGLFLRVGAHTDRLWDKPKWDRAPEVSRRWALGDETEVASAFGGLVYVEVPKDQKPRVVDVRIAGAVEAPLFLLGKTNPKDWKAIRERPAPWAELGTGKLILTLPARAVREIDDPVPVLEFWDRVMDACAELRGIPKARPSPERIVCDKQISVGYMHSGYPIFCHLDQEGKIANLERLRAGNWGLFHELGHNHQHPGWTFQGTTEVTVNLFTLHAFEKVCGIAEPRSSQHGEERAKQITEYRKGGAKFDQWKAKPFLALIMYQQMQEAFGWEAFTKVFRQYDADPRKFASEEAKRDLWMVRMSRAVGRNLGPFFEAWGIPTSQEARQSLQDLPAWPDGSIASGD